MSHPASMAEVHYPCLKIDRTRQRLQLIWLLRRVEMGILYTEVAEGMGFARPGLHEDPTCPIKVCRLPWREKSSLGPLPG